MITHSRTNTAAWADLVPSNHDRFDRNVYFHEECDSVTDESPSAVLSRYSLGHNTILGSTCTHVPGKISLAIEQKAQTNAKAVELLGLEKGACWDRGRGEMAVLKGDTCR